MIAVFVGGVKDRHYMEIDVYNLQHTRVAPIRPELNFHYNETPTTDEIAKDYYRLFKLNEEWYMYLHESLTFSEGIRRLILGYGHKHICTRDCRERTNR